MTINDAIAHARHVKAGMGFSNGIGHVEHIMLKMVDAREISPETINAAAADKRAKISRYLHHAG